TRGGRTSPAEPSIRTVANMSASVGPWLTITIGFPSRAIVIGISAAGHTPTVEPTTRTASPASANSHAFCISSAGSTSPNITVEVFRMPPQCGHPGSSSPASTRLSTSSVGHEELHPMHTTRLTLPWTSATTDSGSPDTRWRPSTFWVMQPARRPARCRSTIARWPRLGCTDDRAPPQFAGGVHAPLAHPDVSVSDVAVDGEVVGVELVPQAIRPAEVGDARLGRDTRTGVDRDPAHV